MNMDLENTMGWIFGLLGASFLALILFSFASKHEVTNYYLSGRSASIYIGLDIDWQEDKRILLDRSVTYNEAISMVDSLNKTLK